MKKWCVDEWKAHAEMEILECSNVNEDDTCQKIERNDFRVQNRSSFFDIQIEIPYYI